MILLGSGYLSRLRMFLPSPNLFPSELSTIAAEPRTRVYVQALSTVNISVSAILHVMMPATKFR
jgi:hypothetical protein